jgi:hypothetical protein
VAHQDPDRCRGHRRDVIVAGVGHLQMGAVDRSRGLAVHQEGDVRLHTTHHRRRRDEISAVSAARGHQCDGVIDLYPMIPAHRRHDESAPRLTTLARRLHGALVHLSPARDRRHRRAQLAGDTPTPGALPPRDALEAQALATVPALHHCAIVVGRTLALRHPVADHYRAIPPHQRLQAASDAHPYQVESARAALAAATIPALALPHHLADAALPLPNAAGTRPRRRRDGMVREMRRHRTALQETRTSRGHQTQMLQMTSVISILAVVDWWDLRADREGEHRRAILCDDSERRGDNVISMYVYKYRVAGSCHESHVNHVLCTVQYQLK